MSVSGETSNQLGQQWQFTAVTGRNGSTDIWLCQSLLS